MQLRIWSPILLAFCGALSTGMVSCSDHGSTRRIDLNNIKIYENPTEIPEDLPGLFIYPKTSVQTAVSYGGGRYVMSTQSVVLQITDHKRVDVVAFYENAFKVQDWKIIQSSQTEDAFLLMAESPSHRLATVILRGENPVQIKLYFKRASLF